MRGDRGMNKCCIGWKEATESIEVIPRMKEIPQDVYMADCLKKLLKSTMGNFCPMCGENLKGASPR